MTPVYHVFKKIIVNSGRKYYPVPLIFDGCRYHIDYPKLKETLKLSDVKILLFCNPNNPTGHKWSADEIINVCKICRENGICVISDEMFSDLSYDKKHISFLEYTDVLDGKLIVCFSPSKAFGLSGIRCGNVVIPDKKIYSEYDRILDKNKAIAINIFGLTALQAAYTHGENYIDDLVVYLNSNIKLISDFFASNIPIFKMIMPQFGYMAWIDTRELQKQTNMIPAQFLEQHAKIGVRDGTIFDNGDGFIRMSFGFPKSTLLRVLERMEKACKKYGLDARG